MRGTVKVGDGNGQSTELTAGDAAAVSEETALQLTAASPAEVMLFDLN